VFNFQAVSASPRLAQIVATAVTQQYLQTTRQLRLRSTEEALSFARDQMAIYERQLEDKRAALNDYQRQMALKQASPTPVSKANLTRVNTMVQAAAADVAAQSSRQESFRQRIREAGLEAYLGLGVIDSPKLDALKQTLYELERTQALAMVEQAEGVAQAEVSQTQSQIAAKSQQLLVEMETLAELALSQLDTDSRQLLVDYEFMAVSTQAARTREEELRNFLDKYAADLSNVPAEEFRLARLEEQVRTAERLYQTWLEQSNATQIAKAVQSADVSQRLVLLEAAQLPMMPVAPDRRQILLVALAMGLALGVGAAVLTEYFDLTLKSVDEIEAVLEAPILGAVPRMQAAVVDHLEARRRRRIWLFASTSVLILLAAVAVGVLYLNS
jgi:uncharacterized protein involved in exopolysaccharide biosynthesis